MFKPTAASVPSTVATTVAAGATMKLFCAARIHSSDSSRLWYQRSDTPGIGYDRKELSENDSGTITRMGSTRNSSTSALKLRSAKNQARSPRDWYGAKTGRNFFMAYPMLTSILAKRRYTPYSTSVARNSSAPSAHAMPQLIVTLMK